MFSTTVEEKRVNTMIIMPSHSPQRHFFINLYHNCICITTAWYRKPGDASHMPWLGWLNESSEQ
jgi:hypothetical protein